MSTPSFVPISRDVEIEIDGTRFHGWLASPAEPRGLVVCAYATGRSRHDARQRMFAALLSESNFAALMCDLLTEEEEELDAMTGEFREASEVLDRRLRAFIRWSIAEPALAGLSIGIFGASTAGAAAIAAAAAYPDAVRAVVTRCARMELVDDVLPRVRAATSLITGELDPKIAGRYSAGLARLGSAEKELYLVPNAGQILSDPVPRRQVAQHASDWFARHLPLEVART